LVEEVDHLVPRVVDLVEEVDHLVPRVVDLVEEVDHLVPKVVDLVEEVDHLVPKVVDYLEVFLEQEESKEDSIQKEVLGNEVLVEEEEYFPIPSYKIVQEHYIVVQILVLVQYHLPKVFRHYKLHLTQIQYKCLEHQE
jgi:uncharacterized protein Yka (UPF0111/DUF47 family)